MSVRRPRISAVSDRRADVRHDTSALGWIIDNDLIVGPALFLMALFAFAGIIIVIMP
jgi:hypothetical protein